MESQKTSQVVNPKQEVAPKTGCIEENRQTRDRPLRWNCANPSIWTDNMLAALDNGVKGNKWFSLIDKVIRLKTLFAGWEKVKSNRGAGGVDRISIEKFEANCATYLVEIHEEMRSGKYQPMPVKRVNIPKGGGKTRPLGIPTIKDRVVQTSLKMVIEPIFENEFHEHSYGFRPGRGAKDALRQVDRLLKEGYTHVVDVDFESFFDTIDHDKLMTLLKEKIVDRRILTLIELFLKQGIMEGMRQWKPDQGTPQGGVISPLLANVFLTPLDRLADELGVTMIRYADDFVIVTKTREEAERAMEAIVNWASEAGLKVHPNKTRLVDYGRGRSFNFLGYRFQRGYRFIRRSSLVKMRDAVRAKTKRTDGRSMENIIASLNRTLKGWYQYFKHAHYTVLKNMDQFVRRRLRAVYRKREKRPGFGLTLEDNRRWPIKHFVGLGLFTMLIAQRMEIMSNHRKRATCRPR